ncbi:hypothetical protein GGD54_001987 [Rhizobium tropici]|uniref:Transposase n=1 Tax=Rhizobium tropici TaxID=398 RepID=A0ABR6QXC3_RHITR|nr:hypothetical protein [Rhizobium tropici]MBB5592187.1 hypothetical protein [Rhizobium tropici]MBB6491592.1 hypothetical protein [Rhizobium tropici]
MPRVTNLPLWGRCPERDRGGYQPHGTQTAASPAQAPIKTEKGRRTASLFIHAIKAALDYALSFGVRT